MKQTICDRCEKVENENASDFFEVSIRQRNLDESKKFDLCLDCVRATKDWLKQ